MVLYRTPNRRSQGLDGGRGRRAAGYGRQGERTEEQECLDRATTRRQRSAVGPAPKGLAGADGSARGGTAGAWDRGVSRIGSRSGRLPAGFPGHAQESDGRAHDEHDGGHGDDRF